MLSDLVHDDRITIDTLFAVPDEHAVFGFGET